MPMFDYCCGRHTTEELFFPKEEIPEEILCSECGDRAIKMLPLVAKTAGRWGDQTGKYGVDGFFDRGLGARYHTSMEREAIMESKGLVDAGCVEDSHFHEDTMEKEAASNARHDANIKRYKASLSKHNDKGRAMAETFSVSEMRKQGTLTDNHVRGE